MISLRKTFRPLTLISYADMATLLSASLGFLAITYIIDGTEKSYISAMLILPFCAIIDGMDGALARKFGTKHHYGKYLDSISDSICFGIAPSILVYSLYYNLDKGPAIDIFDENLEINFRYNIDNIIAISSALSIAILSIIRLANFTIGDQGEKEYFSGLPSPGLTMFIVVISIKYSEINNYSNLMIPLAIGLVSLLTASTIPYAKARKQFKYPILFGLLVLITTISFRYLEYSLWLTLWPFAFILYLVYFLLLPILISNNYFD
jgi:phosphatidylserine synthase